MTIGEFVSRDRLQLTIQKDDQGFIDSAYVVNKNNGAFYDYPDPVKSLFIQLAKRRADHPVFFAAKSLARPFFGSGKFTRTVFLLLKVFWRCFAFLLSIPILT